MRTLNAFVKANIWVFTALGVTFLLWAVFKQHFFGTLFSSDFLPHQFCYLQQPSLIWTNAISDGLIWLSYIAIAVELAVLLWKSKDLLPFRFAFVAFGLFILACGFTHLMEVVTVWIPVYWLSAFIKILTAIASVGTAVVLVPMIPEAAAAIAMFNDARVRTENELDQAVSEVADLEQRQQIALEASGIGTWEMDAETGLIAWDERCAEIFGRLDVEALHYNQFLEFVHPDDRAETEDAVSTALRKHGEYETEYRVIGGDGVTRNVVAKGRAFQNNGNAPTRFIGTVLDVTTQRQSESALVRSEKLAVAGRMAATIAHEINNPISASLDLMFLAKSVEGIPPRAIDYLDTAQQELRRAAEITRNSLAFHRESPNAVPIDFKEILENVIRLQLPRIRKSGVFVRTSYEKVPPTVGFPGELRQVFTNLIVNALDAMEQSSVRKLHVRMRPVSKGITVTIADTGEGISAESMQRLFTPFFTTKGEAGTGVGLWVVERLVSHHNGQVKLRSRLGRGTVFRIVWPTEAHGTEAT